MELAIISDEISMNLEEALEHGCKMGFRKYEIRCFDTYEQRVPDILPAYVDRLKGLVDDGTIEVTALTPGTFKCRLTDKEQVRREMEDILPRTCLLAKELKAPRVIAFSFLREEGIGSEAIVEAISAAGQIAADHGLQLSVENEPGTWCDTGVNTADIISKVNLPNVGINWDVANGVYAYEAAFPVGYDAVLPYLQNVHVKDGIPLPPDKWENRLIGDGGVNWVGQLGALMRDRPVEHITLETHVFPLLESTREDLRRLRKLLQTARDLFEEES